MSDEELADFLCIRDEPRWPELIAQISQEKRALYERMAEVVVEVELYSAGLGPKPEGVLLDFDRKAFR